MVRRALVLLQEGQFSKACKMLVSLGLGDLPDAIVANQLARKHSWQKEALPDTLADFGPFWRLHVRLGPNPRGLRRLAGTGVSGFRNEYLTALTEDFADDHAGEGVPFLEAFAERYVIAELPPWFYAIFICVKLVPIEERPTGLGETPDMRPLGIGECLRIATHSAVLTDFREPLVEYFWPQQIAVGVPGGLSILISGCARC